MRVLMAAAAAVLGLATMAPAATLLTSFENSMAGTRQPYTSFSTTTGVSEGSYSLAIALPAPTFNATDNNYGLYAQAFKFSTNYQTLINAPVKQLAIDVTMPVAPSNQWWWQLQLVLNAQTFGYKASPTLNANANAIPSPTTLTWDYSALDFSTLPATPTYQEIVFVVNAGGDATFVPAPNIYVDNLRIVPEPTALAGLMLASLALVRRRRSR